MQMLFSTKGRWTANGYNIYHHLKIDTNAKTYARTKDAYRKTCDTTATKSELDGIEAKLAADGFTKVEW